MSSFNVLNEDAEEEDLGKVVVQTPTSILKPIRFGQQKNIYKQQQLRRKRASSYTRVSFDSIPIIHEFVVLTKSDIKKAKYEAEKLRRQQEKAERRKLNNSSPLNNNNNNNNKKGGKSSPNNNSPSKKNVIIDIIKKWMKCIHP